MTEPVPGVQFNGPPPHLLQDALRIVNESLDGLSPGKNGAVVGIGTVDALGRTSYNAALVVRKGEDFALITWVGKSWGQRVTYGGGVKWEF